MDKIIESLRYVPKLWTALGYILLLAVSIILFFGRNYEALRSELIVGILPHFYNHVSNLSLSVIIYTAVGYIGIMFGMTTRHILVVGMVIVLINVIVELFIPVLNTPDTIDLAYGLAGALLGFVFLYVAKTKGLMPNTLNNGTPNPSAL